MFVLNVLAFILVGFQLKSIAARLTGATGSALRGRGGGGVRRGDPGAHRVGDRRGGVQPVALPPAPDGKPGPHDAVALDAPARAAGRVVRHARHGDARRRARAPDRDFPTGT